MPDARVSTAVHGCGRAEWRFARVPASWRPRKVGANKVQAPRPDSPAFLFESNNGWAGEMGCFSAAADAAAKTLQKMIEEHKGLVGS